ncbi:hypothetical protein MUK42_24762 [Musa troglodytarum]|uniref:Uncharacterized protein n=1 Tax=Musa troglodytarum TaxID=320322 RepID=A0A9E7HR42_9LILI|nr:hypothetical protein MUK42_24762 [Musa troglodytarum]
MGGRETAPKVTTECTSMNTFELADDSLFKGLADSFHTTDEAASETTEDSPTAPEEKTPPAFSAAVAMKSSKYMVQPLSSEEAEPTLEKKALSIEELIDSSILGSGRYGG